MGVNESLLRITEPKSTGREDDGFASQKTGTLLMFLCSSSKLNNHLTKTLINEGEQLRYYIQVCINTYCNYLSCFEASHSQRNRLLEWNAPRPTLEGELT